MNIILAHPVKMNMPDLVSAWATSPLSDMPIVRMRRGYNAPPLQIISVDETKSFDSIQEMLESMGGSPEDIAVIREKANRP